MDAVQLTKPGIVAEGEKEAAEEKQLYEVLPEVDAQTKDGQIFGSKVAYVLNGDSAAEGAEPDVQLSKHAGSDAKDAGEAGTKSTVAGDKPSKKPEKKDKDKSKYKIKF